MITFYNRDQDLDTPPLERIGKGRYTEAWTTADKSIVYLLVSSAPRWTEDLYVDYSKEAIAGLDNSHLPDLHQVFSDGYVQKRNGATSRTTVRYVAQIFTAPYYRPLTAKSANAWNQFKILLTYYKQAHDWFRTTTWYNQPNYYDFAIALNVKFDDLVQADDRLPTSLRKGIHDLCYELQNYGGCYQLEIAKRNCAVDDEDQLILLDPAFSRKEIHQSYVKRANRRL